MLHRLHQQVSLLFVLLAGIAGAQEYRARVQGVVSDSTNAVIAGADVRLRNVNTGVEVARQTNAYGRYLFDLVEPGTYALAAEMAGFSKFLQDGLHHCFLRSASNLESSTAPILLNLLGRRTRGKVEEVMTCGKV